MERNIPVPAESLRTIARDAVDSAREQRSEYPHRARRVESCAGEAFSALDGKNGEFVSINASTVSTLCSEATNRQHRAAARKFLELYGIWG